MSAQLKEALAALESLSADLDVTDRERIDKAYDALELAARESEAWEAIEVWLRINPTRSVGVARDAQYRAALFKGTGTLASQIFRAETRLEALEAAAKFCREEMAKT